MYQYLKTPRSEKTIKEQRLHSPIDMVDFCIVEYHGARLWNENKDTLVATCPYL